jgi:hypothetical protein
MSFDILLSWSAHNELTAGAMSVACDRPQRHDGGVSVLLNLTVKTDRPVVLKFRVSDNRRR